MDATIPAHSLVEIERVLAVNAEIRALIEELDRELSANYPSHQRHGLGLEAIFQPHIRFFVARKNGIAVGCGGIALLPGGFAEIKRMYVRSESRGGGVADAIIARLTADTMDAGRTVLKLETGTRQIAAIRFYQRCGFQSCAAFEPYSSMPPEAIASSMFLEKRLEAI